MLSLDVVAGMVGDGCSLAECSRIQSVLWSDGAVGIGSEEGAAVRRREEYAAFGQGDDCESPSHIVPGGINSGRSCLWEDGY